MQKFTGIDYIRIDIANQLGMDKITWDQRIDFIKNNDKILETLTNHADDPILCRKSIRALRNAKNGTPTGFIMGLDATASGIQIMACLMGCKTTAYNVNLTNSKERKDVYSTVAKNMSNISNKIFTREIVKYPVMTTFYGSLNQPKEIFGDNTLELAFFYTTLLKELPGAMQCMDDMQSCWQPNNKEHLWTLPDGHIVKVKVKRVVNKKIEIDELDHATFTYRGYINEPAKKGLSLAANIIHSIDGYINRCMIRLADEQGFEMLHIHDSFWASPNYMNEVRQNYVDILSDIAKTDLLEHILREVTQTKESIKKFSDDLYIDIKESEYALS